MANLKPQTKKVDFSLGRLPQAAPSGDGVSSDALVRSSFTASRELVRRLRVLAATSGRTQGSLLEEAITELLAKYGA